MNWRKFVIGILALRAATVWAADSVSTNVEPRFEDKSLSEWIALSEPSGGEILAPKDWRSAYAVRQIGTNAIPWLLRWIRSNNPLGARYGIRGVSLLREHSKLLLPELETMVNDWPSSTAWSNAIPALEALGNDGFPDLLRAATNSAAPSAFRSKAIQSIEIMGSHMNGLGSLAALGTNASQAIPVLIRCLRDGDWEVASQAANALGTYTIEPAVAVPALATALQVRTNPPPPLVPPATDPQRWRGDVSVRWAAAHSLLSFGEVIRLGNFPQNFTLSQPNVPEYRDAMRSAVPALVKALNDDDPRVSYWAALALGEAGLEPDRAVPALIAALGHSDASLRRAAAEALGDFGPAAQSAVPALTKLLDNDRVSSDARIALEKITADKTK